MVEIEQQKRPPNVSLDLRPCDKTQFGSEPGARALLDLDSLLYAPAELSVVLLGFRKILGRPLVENLDLG